MTKPLYWAITSLVIILLFYFVMDGGLWTFDVKSYEESDEVMIDDDPNMTSSADNLFTGDIGDRETYYYTMRGGFTVEYNKVEGGWEEEKSDTFPYTFLPSLEVIMLDSDSSVSDIAKVMAWMFVFASISQFFACISFLCSLYHHIKSRWVDQDYILWLSVFSLTIVIIVPLISGIYFFFSFPNAIEEDISFFSQGVDADSNTFFGSFISDSSVAEIAWRPAIYWFFYILLIPVVAVVNLLGYNSTNLESYYSGSGDFEFGDRFMELPDHEDQTYVSFRGAVGYGVSTITYWIGYIFIVFLIGAFFSVTSVWLLSKNTVTSYVLVSIFGFFYFILTLALILAISYKYLTDIRLRGNLPIVDSLHRRIGAPLDDISLSHGKTINRPSPLKSEKIFFEKPVIVIKKDSDITISCPSCDGELNVKSTNKMQKVKCPNCGAEGEITV